MSENKITSTDKLKHSKTYGEHISAAVEMYFDRLLTKEEYYKEIEKAREKYPEIEDPELQMEAERIEMSFKETQEDQDRLDQMQKEINELGI